MLPPKVKKTNLQHIPRVSASHMTMFQFDQLNALDLRGYGDNHFEQTTLPYPNFNLWNESPQSAFAQGIRTSAYEHHLKRLFFENFVRDIEVKHREYKFGEIVAMTSRFFVHSSLVNNLKRLHSIQIVTDRTVNINFLAGEYDSFLDWELYHAYYEKYLNQVRPGLPSKIFYWVQRYLSFGLNDLYHFPPRFTAADRKKESPVAFYSNQSRPKDVAIHVETDWYWDVETKSAPSWIVRFSCQDNVVAKEIKKILEGPGFKKKLTEWVRNCEFLAEDEAETYLGMSKKKFNAFQGLMFNTKCVFTKNRFLFHEYTDTYLYVWPTYQWKEYSGSTSNEIRNFLSQNEDTQDELKCYFHDFLRTEERSPILFPWIEEDLD